MIIEDIALKLFMAIMGIYAVALVPFFILGFVLGRIKK